VRHRALHRGLKTNRAASIVTESTGSSRPTPWPLRVGCRRFAPRQLPIAPDCPKVSAPLASVESHYGRLSHLPMWTQKNLPVGRRRRIPLQRRAGPPRDPVSGSDRPCLRAKTLLPGTLAAPRRRRSQLAARWQRLDAVNHVVLSEVECRLLRALRQTTKDPQIRRRRVCLQDQSLPPG
jgi:hypothetical protein